MVKFRIIKVEHPNSFVGQDLSIFEKVNEICEHIANSNSKILPCSEVSVQKIYLARFMNQIVRIRVLTSINSNAFRCLLIDYGKIEEFRRQTIYNLPLNLIEISPAVKVIKIPGIRPSGMSQIPSGANIRVQLCQSDKWMPASYKFISRLFEEQNVVHVNCLRQIGKDKMLADVSVIQGTQRVNLRDLLICQGYAFVVPNANDCSSSEITCIDNQDAESIVTNVDSLENESITTMIDNMKEDEISEAPSTMPIINTTSIEISVPVPTIHSKITKPMTPGFLDELSLPILKLKVKCWCVEKILNNSPNKSDDNAAAAVMFRYRDTVRPITSYKNEPSLANFLKNAMVAYDTKLLLLIQAYMIPTMLRGVNMVSIAPAKKGKSMGLLMPILQTIATKKMLPSRSYNPLAIILCSSWKKVKDLNGAAEKFIRFISESDNVHKPRIVAMYAGSMKKLTMMPILQGCDVLIITPTCLLNLLRQHEFFKLNELEIFCLDDAENVIAEHLETLKEIMIFKRAGAIDRGSEPGQFITATNWTSGLESYVKYEMGDVFSIVVNDPLELAVIGRMKQTIIEYDDIEGELYQKLVAYLQLVESSIKRTIIFASDDYEIASVYKFLMQKARVDLKLMTGSMNDEELEVMVREWNQYRGYVNMPILLISDEALRSSVVSIFNADIIIHVDINESSFGTRLNFLRDKYADLTFLKSKSERAVLEANEKANSFIFICPKTINLAIAHFLYRFLGRCKSTRPGWLQDKAIDFILNNEKSKGCNDICPRIKSFGECKLPGCAKRHMVISEMDKPLLPNRGHIQFQLLHLDSPSHFFVRITEFSEQLDPGRPFRSQYLSLKMKMANYFGNNQNIHGVNLRSVQPGLIAAIKMREILERVMVVKMRTNRPGVVLVKLIDVGSEMVIEQAELLHLPRELSDIAAQAVEIYVTNMRPIDNDEHYSDEICQFAQEFLQDKELHGLIKLCIGSTLWIDAVTERIHHVTTKLVVFDNNLSVALLEKNLAEKNPHHVDKLIRLCTGKIDIWKPQEIRENHHERQQPIAIMRRFSYDAVPIVFENLPIFDDDNQISTNCAVTNIVSPNFLFLNNKETAKALRDMHMEIEALIDSIENVSFRELKPGTRVLYLNGVWRRGCILKATNEEISIFSLDSGVVGKYFPDQCQLKRLPLEYQELPYQAILCSLLYCNHSASSSYSSDVAAAIRHYVTADQDKDPVVEVFAYEVKNVSVSMFCDEMLPDCNTNIEELDLLQPVQRFAVTISNRCVKEADEMLHFVLIRNQNVLPSLEFTHEVLPESRSFASRLVRNGSIPHLVTDILLTKNYEKRLKTAQTIERIVYRKKECFVKSRCVSENVALIIDSLAILMAFINDQEIYMCIYRSLNMLLCLAYDKLEIEQEKQTLSIQFITTILVDYKSATYFMLKHLEISARSAQVENCRIILDNFRMLLLDPVMVTCFFSDKTWCEVMATCISTLKVDKDVYNLLMDILVQLTMLWKSNAQLLNDLLTQCCLAFHQSDCPMVWNASMSLITCFVNVQAYSPIFRNLNFFEIVFDKLIQHFNDIGHWEEIHDNALDILSNMWRNGSANKSAIIAKRKLSKELEAISKNNADNTSLNVFVTNVILEECSVSMHNGAMTTGNSTGGTTNTVPDIDAQDWMEGRGDISTKKYRRSYGRIFCESDTGSSSEDKNESDTSDSDSSDVGATPFIDSNMNPADEDNVYCFEKA